MKMQPTIATLALLGTLGVATALPAQADSAASTRNIILGVAAAVAGIAVEANVDHKRAVASTVQGYLPNGATVYEDGRVVEPDGTAYYPGNDGQQVACSDQNCSITDSNGRIVGYDGRNVGYDGHSAGYDGGRHWGNRRY